MKRVGLLVAVLTVTVVCWSGMSLRSQEKARSQPGPERDPTTSEADKAESRTKVVEGRIVKAHDDLVILETPGGQIVVVTPNSRRVIVVGADATIRMNNQPATLATLREGAAAAVEFVPKEGLSPGKSIVAVQAPGAGTASASGGAGVPVGAVGAGRGSVTPGSGITNTVVTGGGGLVADRDGRFAGPFAFGIAPVATDTMEGIISRVQDDVVFVRGNDGREFAVPVDRSTRFRARARNDGDRRGPDQNDADRRSFTTGTAVRLSFDTVDGTRTPTIQAIDPGPTNPIDRSVPTAGNPIVPPPGAANIPTPGVQGVPTPGLPEQFGGTISRVVGNNLFMRTTAGQEFIIPTNNDTQFMFNNQAARFQQFQPGMDIQVGQRARGAGQPGMTISGSPGKAGSRSAPGGGGNKK